MLITSTEDFQNKPLIYKDKLDSVGNVVRNEFGNSIKVPIVRAVIELGALPDFKTQFRPLQTLPQLDHPKPRVDAEVFHANGLNSQAYDDCLNHLRGMLSVTANSSTTQLPVSVV